MRLGVLPDPKVTLMALPLKLLFQAHCEPKTMVAPVWAWAEEVSATARTAEAMSLIGRDIQFDMVVFLSMWEGKGPAVMGFVFVSV
jgi:hypothetical protein